MLRKTKLVCTIGPASSPSWVIEKMIQAGMNVARLNFSHGTWEEHAEVIRTIRDISAALDIPVAILIDLPGPKPRTGRLKEKRVYIKEGDNFSLTSERVLGDEHRISVDFPAFFNDIRAGDPLFLNDGVIQLKVPCILL